MFFNKFVKNLKPYTVSTHKAWEFINHDDVLKLDWNESTVPPTPRVRDDLAKSIENGLMNWYPNIDNIELRTMLAEYSSVNIDQIEYFGSSDALHEYIIRAFINPGDTITMVAPTYDNFRAAAESVGAEIDFFELDKEQGFSFEFDKFEVHIEEQAPKIVYLCNPNNPTGTTYSTELLERVIRRFNDVLFIIDEAYYEFIDVSGARLSTVYENLVVCRTFSKAFGLASFRIGYAISSPHNIEGLKKVRNPKNISSYAQLAAIAALSDVEYMQNYVKEVLLAKEFFIEQLKSVRIPVIGSEGGNFVLVDFGDKQQDIVGFLESSKVFVRNYGHVHGMDKYTRITIGTREQMIRVFSLIKEIF